MTTILTPPGQTGSPGHDDDEPQVGHVTVDEPQVGHVTFDGVELAPAVTDRPASAPVTDRPQRSVHREAPGRPGPAGAPKPPKQLGATAALVAAAVVLLGGLLFWVALGGSNRALGSIHSWEQVPKGGQPYYVAPPKPVLPPSVAAAVAAGKVTLPPMVVSTPTTSVTLKVDPPPFGGMYGSDGQVHDNFSPAYFAVPAGKTAHVTVYNYDDMWHTFTSPALGLNVWIKPGGDHPSTTTFTFTAPSTGNYWWLCDIPCDPYAMNTGGYMQGEIHAVKA